MQHTTDRQLGLSWLWRTSFQRCVGIAQAGEKSSSLGSREKLRVKLWSCDRIRGVAGLRKYCVALWSLQARLRLCYASGNDASRKGRILFFLESRYGGVRGGLQANMDFTTHRRSEGRTSSNGAICEVCPWERLSTLGTIKNTILRNRGSSSGTP